MLPLLITIAIAAEPAPAPAPTPSVVPATAQFAIDFLRAATKGTIKNFIASPYSIQQGVSMARVGAVGQTRDELTRALRLDSIADDADAAFAALHAQLTAAARTPKPTSMKGDATPFTLSIANHLWADNSVRLKPDFTRTLSTSFHAESTRLAFSDPEKVARRVNSWVAGETRKRIPTLISANAVPRSGLILTNAVYFNASWTQSFHNCPDFEFNLTDGSKLNTPAFTRSDPFPFVEFDGGRAVRLPYFSGASMLVILPDAGKFQQVLDTLDLTTLDFTRPSVDVVVTIPKFKFETRLDCADMLKAMGARLAFDPNADFTRMTDDRPAYISAVIHAANIAVDEVGTEAAAASAVLMELASAAPDVPPEPIIFAANRPFLFFITHGPNNAPIFAGILADPR
ncbi:MAG: serpin family protein [Planctomycetota bacterium]|nr:serpin family protein [Planctomycetota bacterium]